jgi:hypothetical protein
MLFSGNKKTVYCVFEEESLGYPKMFQNKIHHSTMDNDNTTDDEILIINTR